MYALNLGEGERILSACVKLNNQEYVGMVYVDKLPEGDIINYKYVDGDYIYDPLPKPEPITPEPTIEEDMQALIIDHEYRLTLIELGIM